MGKRPNPTLIGAFVLGGVALLALAIVTFGSGRFFRSTQKFVLYFQGSVNGLEKGAPVKFRGVPIGVVTDILLALPEKRGDPRIPVMIEIDRDRVTELGFSREMTSGPAVMDRLAREGGLRAQLQQQSLITGLLYIGLDLLPDSPLERVLPPNSSYAEIPTLPTTLEQAQAKLREIVDRLSHIDFEAFGKSLSGAVDGFSQLVNSPDLQSTIVAMRDALVHVRDTADTLRSGIRPLATSVDGTTQDLRGAIQRLQATLDKFDALADPHAPLVQELTTALGDLGEAARAVRQLAENLNRDPSVLLTGKKAP